MAFEMVWFAVATLLAPVFAEYSKIRVKAEREFAMIAVAGIHFLLAMAFELQLFTTFAGSYAVYLSYLFQFLGWLVLLIAVIMATLKLVKV